MTPERINKIVLYHLPKDAPLPPFGHVKAAINSGLLVLCRINATGPVDIAVKDVRRMGNLYQVKLAEGWRTPLEVWTKEQPEPTLHRQVQAQTARRMF